VGIPPIESIAMIRYLMYKKNVKSMDNKRLPKIASDSSQNHQRLKQGWHNDAKPWLNRIKEEVILQNINDIKSILQAKFKENIWCDKELEDKRKSRYYKEVISPNLEEKNISLCFD
jgi:hypothetical protein